MVTLDFGCVRYCNLVADKQQNAYISACSGGGKILQGDSTEGAVSIEVIPGTCNRGNAKLLKLLSLTNLPVNISEERKKTFLQHSVP